MSKQPGSLWVSGSTLRFVDSSGYEYYYTGSLVNTPAKAVPGSIWIEGYDFHYIDSTGNNRVISNYTNTAVSGAVKGSIWIQGATLRWINESGYIGYGHSDANNNIAHGDAPHADVPAHTDTPYQDHHDGCGPGFTDYNGTYLGCPYSDHRMPGYTNHSDVTYTDCYYNDYTRNYTCVTAHSDVAHSDVPAYGDHTDAPTYVGP